MSDQIIAISGDQELSPQPQTPVVQNIFQVYKDDIVARMLPAEVALTPKIVRWQIATGILMQTFVAAACKITEVPTFGTLMLLTTMTSAYALQASLLRLARASRQEFSDTRTVFGVIEDGVAVSDNDHSAQRTWSGEMRRIRANFFGKKL